MDPARLSPSRPIAVAIAAAILVGGGLVGFTQLAFGTYVVTGSLPAKAPILGVAFMAYAACLVAGVLAWLGHGWLAAINLAAVVAVLYLPAAGRPLTLGLVIAHSVAVFLLARSRPWFAEMAARRGRSQTSSPGRATVRRRRMAEAAQATARIASRVSPGSPNGRAAPTSSAST
jgi:hypothetical protein